VLAFDGAAIGSSEGRVTLDLALNLVARLYPRISIIGLDRVAKRHVSEREAVAASINPQIDFVKRPDERSLRLVVGVTSVSDSFHRVYVGSSGWVARLSSRQPVGSADTLNPFGAAAAACFGAANIFRLVFADQLPGGQPDETLNLSLLTYEQGDFQKNPVIPETNVTGSCLVGVGAIGNAFCWVLARLPQLTGSLDLVDHEPVELSNLQRYVLTAQDKVGVNKVDLAADVLRHNGFAARPHPVKWVDYLGQRGDFNIERLIVAVDTAADRIAMQASLPRWVFNAWTQNHDLGVSRHDFLSVNACLMCLYLPTGKQLDEDEIVAQAFGIPEAKKDVIRPLLYRNGTMTPELLTQIGTSLNLNVDELQTFAGKPIREFYTEAFCGGAIFKISNGGQPSQALVPMAFQSALAGIMLAAEAVAHSCQLKSVPPPVTSTINLLRPLAPYTCFARKKAPSGRCICQDVDYQTVFRDKWPTP